MYLLPYKIYWANARQRGSKEEGQMGGRGYLHLHRGPQSWQEVGLFIDFVVDMQDLRDARGLVIIPGMLRA